MRVHNDKSEKGEIEVEATIILPIAILSIILLLYLSLFLFQRANLQACLETSVIYYKNSVTDTYVKRNDTVSYDNNDKSHVGKGNTYSAESPLFPYRGIFDSGEYNSQEEFEKYFDSVAGRMLFGEPDVSIEYSNYVLLRQFEVTAIQTVSSPVDFSILGIGNEYKVSATARVSVVDHDALIRNADFAIDLLEDTKLGEMAKNFASKVGEVYNKIKDMLK